MIANRDQRYNRIAKACLAVINAPDVHVVNKKDLIAEIYNAIDSAISQEQSQLLKDLEELQQAVTDIHELAQNGDAEACHKITTTLIS